MEAVLSKIVGPVLAGAIGYLLGRWSKHKQIIYSKKVELYSTLVKELLNFILYCAPRKNLTFKQYTDTIRAFNNLQQAFHETGLFMPRKLYEDIQCKFSPAIKRIGSIATFFERIHKLKEGNKDINVPFDKFKQETLESLGYLMELPGPFEPLVKSIPEIVQMLKKDLGIDKLDSKFYK